MPLNTRQFVFEHHTPIKGLPFTVIPDAAMRRICSTFNRDVNSRGCWSYASETARRPNVIVTIGGAEHSVRGSRLALLLLNDAPIPIGLNANHTCPNVWCVCPTHLYAGTQADNMLDAYMDGRRTRLSRLCAPSRPRASADRYARLLREWAARESQTIKCTRFFCDDVQEEIRHGGPALQDLWAREAA